MTVRLIGSGGVEFTFDLPLPAVYQEQLDKGQLKTADGDLEPSEPPRAGKGSGRASWAAWYEHTTGEAPDDDWSKDRIVDELAKPATEKKETN